MPKMCVGSPRCAICGAPHPAGVVQNCPAPAGVRVRTVAERAGDSECGTCGPPGGPLDLWRTRSAAIDAWQAAGRPVRSQQRVEELLAICQACPELVARGTPLQRCGVCGCLVNSGRKLPTLNKLAMATERCPLQPPRWEADEPP